MHQRLNDTIPHSKLWRWLSSGWRSCLFCVLGLFLASTGIAAEPTKLVTYLTEEKSSFIHAIQEVKQLLPPENDTQLAVRNKQNDTLLALMQAKVANLESFLNQQVKEKQLSQIKLKKLQRSDPNGVNRIEVQDEMNHLNTSLAFNMTQIHLINANLVLARQYQQALMSEKKEIGLWQAKFAEEAEIAGLEKRIKDLHAMRDHLYQKNILLQQQKKTGTDFAFSFNNEAKLLLNNQVIILIQHRITTLELKKRLCIADYSLIKNHDIKTLEEVKEVYQDAIDQFSSIETALQSMAKLLKHERALLNDTDLKQQYHNLQATVLTRISEVANQQALLEKQLAMKQTELKKQLSVRQSLSEYQFSSWPLIVKQISQVPSQCYIYLKILLLKARDNYVWKEAGQATFFWLSLGVLCGLSLGLIMFLQKLTQDKSRSRLSAHLFDGILIVLYRCVPQITLVSLIGLTFILNQVPFASFQLLMKVMLLYLGFRILNLIARLTLLERMTNVKGKDVKLYHHLKWLIIAGGWSSSLMVLSEGLPLSGLLQDLCNHLFMIVLLTVAIVALKSREIISELLQPKKRYLCTAIRLLTVLVPLALLTTSVIGLVGYFNLAWNLSGYQVYLVLLITNYVLLRGLITDLLELFSEWMIKSLRNGWLWTEVFLKPLDTGLHLSLIVATLFLIGRIFGLTPDSWFVQTLVHMGKYPFINVSGVHITLFSTLEFVLLSFVMTWTSKWTREFAYRWLYRNARDAGIRHSLSAFTQYAVILVGGLITLRVLGLDFSGMSMVLGGLAVGMGFGLRDFASNIVGGLTLLVERPVREGDLITLGEHEGKVSHIGIRSMRVSSWDNTEVLIPNAETFNKPFINWTHQDNIVRTVFPIKVSRHDDPVMIQHLILDILASIEEVLQEPAPQVLLKNIDDVLLEFEVRYFINVVTHTRFEVRSKVLLAIHEQFKNAHIEAPIPALTVELTDKEHLYYGNKAITERS